jgi:photosystem II stability/assembly factor-like uncharacterized protein
VATKRLASGIASIIVLLAALGAFLAPAALAATPLTTPDGLWTWVRPLPFGYQANTIAAPTPGSLFVGTTAPDVLVTRDASASWLWSPTNVKPGLFFGGIQSLAFPAVNEGWAGAEGALLHTSDGGQSWQTQISRPGLLQFDLLSFSDMSSGWAVAEDLDYVELYATGDGGQTWRQATLPGADTTFTTLASQGPGQALVFEEQWQSGIGNGEDYGLRLYRTTDYGAHWTLLPALRNYYYCAGAAFVSPTRGWAIVGGLLWQTDDGGSHWRKLSQLAGGPPFGKICTVGNDVWVVGPKAILHSPDAGGSWQRRPGVRLSYPPAISFTDGREGWVTTGNAYLHTTDGAKTWRHVINRPAHAVSDLAAGTGATVWGTAGYVVKSSDGGAHWTQLTTRHDLNAIAAIGTRRAWAVGPKGLVIQSVDSGRHWSKQRSGTSAGLADVCFVDATHGWVAGEKTIRRTIDGGRHWMKASKGIQRSLQRIVFADARHGIALPGSASFIYTTSDGGRSWIKTTFSSDAYHAVGITMIDATHWLLISTMGFAWTTSDGGRTWQRGPDLPKPFGDYVAIERSGSLLCVVDSGGEIATSADGGATWSLDDQLAGVVSCAQFVGDRTLLVAGVGILTRDLSRTSLR